MKICVLLIAKVTNQEKKLAACGLWPAAIDQLSYWAIKQESRQQTGLFC